MKQLMKKSIFLVSITSLLASCTPLNSGFDCPNQAGVMCKSLDQIDGMVNDGQIRGRTQSTVRGSDHQNLTEFQPYTVTSGFYPGAPLRYGETVQRIWIAPYEDREGNYHQDNYLYTVVKEGHWIGLPEKTK